MFLPQLPDLPSASCRTVDPELFYPPAGFGRPKAESVAKEICGGCPERVACLESAMRAEAGESAKMRAGVWGGTTPAERARMASAG